MRSQRSKEGYLLIDHRNSPGVPLEMILASGKFAPDVAAGAAGAVFESATITCSHCQVVVILNPDRGRPRNFCAKCDHYVCDKPGCVTQCIPMNQVFDEIQNQAFHLIGKENTNGQTQL